MPRGIYQRTEPVGFLHPIVNYAVAVETIGVVHEGRNRRDAERAEKRWRKYAAAPIGRAAGKTVTLSAEPIAALRRATQERIAAMKPTP